MVEWGTDEISSSAVLGHTEIGSKTKIQILSLFKMFFGSLWIFCINFDFKNYITMLHNLMTKISGASLHFVLRWMPHLPHFNYDPDPNSCYVR